MTKFNLEEITSSLIFIYFVHIQIKDLLFSCNQHHQSELPPKRVARQKNSTPGISIIELTNCYSLVCSSDHFQLQVARISTSMSLRNKRFIGSFYLCLYCCSVTKSCPTLQLDYSTPGSPALHCLPVIAQIYVH